jgi:hypothetical protein
MIKLLFDIDSAGDKLLVGRTFKNMQFSDLEIIPLVGRKIRIENCSFLNCSTSPGTCVIGSDVSLHRVVISNLDCGDAIRIDTNTELMEVVISGEKPSRLIMRPGIGNCVMSEPKHVEFQLDISSFLGEVEIVGMRGNMVRKDSSRHVIVKAVWKNEVDWKGLGIGPFSFWPILVKKLSLANAEEGVFSLPDRSDKDYTDTIRERELIEKSGVPLI